MAKKPAARPVPKKAARPAREAVKKEAPEVVEPKVRNARIAAGAVLFVVAAVEFATAFYTTALVVTGLLVILGVVAVLLGVYLYRGRFTAWGTSMFVNALGVLLALLQLGTLLGRILLVVLAASYVVLYIVRLSYGVGAWEIEAGKENVGARSLIQARTANPAGTRCPKCGNERLWIAEDGSAFCFACRTGTIELAGREPS